MRHAARLSKMSNGHPRPSYPFLIRCAVSIPLKVATADPSDLKPIIGRVRRFTPRWSCLTMLLRYFDLWIQIRRGDPTLGNKITNFTI